MKARNPKHISVMNPSKNIPPRLQNAFPAVRRLLQFGCPGRLLLLIPFLLGAVNVQAANGTWTNAPVDATWTNVLNWVGAVPGQVNNTANNGVDSSVALFTNAITTYGDAAHPIVTDDATVANGKARMMGRLNFSGPNCGAYVFYSPSPYVANTNSQTETGVMSLCIPSSATFWNGSYINSDVTQPQTFLIPVQIRLPSSTTGQYGFTNNAVNPNATYFFSQMWLYPGATGRGVTFVLAGSNTGTNTIAYLSQSAQQTGSPSGIRKEGTGRWILSGTNNFNAGSAMNINEGTLEVQNTNAFGAAATSVTVNSNGVLQVDGLTLNVASFNLQRHGTFRMNGSGTNNAVNVGTTVGGVTEPILATTSSGDVLTVGPVTNGASDAILHVAGPGTVVLNSPSSGSTAYIGSWSFDAGTTKVGDPNALGAGPLASVGPGAVLDLTALGAISWTPGITAIGGKGSAVSGSSAATIATASGAIINLVNKGISINFTPTGFSGDTTHPSFVVSGGSLSIGTTIFTINNASGTPLGLGTYLLAQQSSGSVSDAGSDVVLMTGSGVAFGTLGTIQCSGGNIYLVVVPYTPKNLSWKGGNPNSTWDTTTKNWWDGIEFTNFNTSDYALFDATGYTNPIVNIPGVVVPTVATVDTTATNYTFTGSGQIGGPASLVKTSAGTLTIANVNSYLGGTAINAGSVKVGINNALPPSGTVTIQSTALLDLNSFNDSIGALAGNGTVDNTGSGAASLSIGSDNSSAIFSGVIQSSSNSVSVTKLGLGTQTLNGANTYVGPTTINNGVLRIGSATALGADTNTLTINSGILDLGTSATIGSLTGAGVVENDSSTAVNTLTIQNAGATTYNGNIQDGTGGGAVAVRIINGASLTFAGNNTYSGGTFVGTNSTFAIPNGPAAVGGFVVASNGATLALSGGSSTPGTPTNVVTVDGASVSFTSGALGKIWAAQFQGSANTTNRILNQISFGGDTSFKNFNGIVSLEQSGDARFINIPTGAFGGGDAATFAFVGNTAVVLTRDAATVTLGNITGGGITSGIDTATGGGTDTYILGAKGVDTAFGGFIRGLNNIVKAGGGALALGGGYSTNIYTVDGFTFYTNLLATNLLSYSGTTTVSNGVLKLAVPDIVTNSPVIRLASPSAVLDVTQVGTLTNQYASDNITITNQILTTNGVFELVAGQSLAGIGTVLASNVLMDAGSTLSPGSPLGLLNANQNVELAGSVGMSINVTGTPTNCSQLAAATIAMDPTATLTVTNLGPENAATFHLFNHPVSFASVTLPTLSGTNTWINNLAVDGSITMVAPALIPVNTNAPVMTNTYNPGSGTLTLSWPSAGYVGYWHLQVQTNVLSTGIYTNWVDVAGSINTNQEVIPVNPANGAVFYRMVYP